MRPLSIAFQRWEVRKHERNNPFEIGQLTKPIQDVTARTPNPKKKDRPCQPKDRAARAAEFEDEL
jgi:hypothetical protein